MLRVGFFHIALLIAGVVSAGYAWGLPAKTDKQVVILESPGSRLSKGVRENLRTAIGDVVANHGLGTVSVQALPDRLLRCDVPACLPQIAAATGAALVLRVDARFAKESFALVVELWSSDDRKLLGREGRDCPICDEQDLWGSAALLVQGLLDRVLRDSKPSPVEPEPVSTSTQASRPQPALAPAAGAESSGRWAGRAGYAGLSLAVAGAAVLGAGIYYVAIDGDHACQRCDWLNDTMNDGQRLAIGGAAILAVGAGLLLWRFWPAAPAVSLGPSGVLVAGHFR